MKTKVKNNKVKAKKRSKALKKYMKDVKGKLRERGELQPFPKPNVYKDKKKEQNKKECRKFKEETDN
jgi:hypothetical protein